MKKTLAILVLAALLLPLGTAIAQDPPPADAAAPAPAGQKQSLWPTRRKASTASVYIMHPATTFSSLPMFFVRFSWTTIWLPNTQ